MPCLKYFIYQTLFTDMSNKGKEAGEKYGDSELNLNDFSNLLNYFTLLSKNQNIWQIEYDSTSIPFTTLTKVTYTKDFAKKNSIPDTYEPIFVFYTENHKSQTPENLNRITRIDVNVVTDQDNISTRQEKWSVLVDNDNNLEIIKPNEPFTFISSFKQLIQRFKEEDNPVLKAQIFHYFFNAKTTRDKVKIGFALGAGIVTGLASLPYISHKTEQGISPEENKYIEKIHQRLVNLGEPQIANFYTQLRKFGLKYDPKYEGMRNFLISKQYLIQAYIENLAFGNYSIASLDTLNTRETNDTPEEILRIGITARNPSDMRLVRQTSHFLKNIFKGIPFLTPAIKAIARITTETPSSTSVFYYDQFYKEINIQPPDIYSSSAQTGIHELCHAFLNADLTEVFKFLTPRKYFEMIHQQMIIGTDMLEEWLQEENSLSSEVMFGYWSLNYFGLKQNFEVFKKNILHHFPEMYKFVDEEIAKGTNPENIIDYVFHWAMNKANRITRQKERGSKIEMSFENEQFMNSFRSSQIENLIFSHIFHQLVNIVPTSYLNINFASGPGSLSEKGSASKSKVFKANIKFFNYICEEIFKEEPEIVLGNIWRAIWGFDPTGKVLDRSNREGLMQLFINKTDGSLESRYTSNGDICLLVLRPNLFFISPYNSADIFIVMPPNGTIGNLDKMPDLPDAVNKINLVGRDYIISKTEVIPPEGSYIGSPTRFTWLKQIPIPKEYSSSIDRVTICNITINGKEYPFILNPYDAQSLQNSKDAHDTLVILDESGIPFLALVENRVTKKKFQAINLAVYEELFTTTVQPITQNSSTMSDDVVYESSFNNSRFSVKNADHVKIQELTSKNEKPKIFYRKKLNQDFTISYKLVMKFKDGRIYEFDINIQ